MLPEYILNFHFLALNCKPEKTGGCAKSFDEGILKITFIHLLITSGLPAKKK